jgi:hypothetical protein
MPRELREVPVKQGSAVRKSGRVFGQGQKRAKMVRAGLYARVSTQDQQTLPMQNRAMREYAARRGWTIAMQVKEVGQLACPPDDCGGIPGFYDLVEAIADPNHEQHKELRDWLGYDFDPMAFSIDSVNQMLLPARRRGKAPGK